MHVVTGTEQTRTEHSTASAATGILVSVGIPALVALAGIWSLGWDAISWAGAIVWGIVGAAGFSLVVEASKAMGYTRIDFADLLGSMFAPPGSTASRVTGSTVHFVNGALLAIAWAYGVALIESPANWFTAMVWGAVLWALGLLLLTSLGPAHPAIRRGEQHDPGMAGTNFGRATPTVSFLGHMAYGALLGGLYQTWPLA